MEDGNRMKARQRNPLDAIVRGLAREDADTERLRRLESIWALDLVDST
jgi:hypothetical protein